MARTQTCRLCQNTMDFYANTRDRDYYRCPNCDSIQLSIQQLLPKDLEEKRYQLHNNDVNDLGYQSFVSPITDYVFNKLESKHMGLDFGAGPGPVITKILRKHAYHIDLYDPYFHPQQDLLDKTYDYIIACEVIEHFNQPKQTFDQLYALTKRHGLWIFMTELYHDDIDFSSWYYKNDETHVIFYTRKTMSYIEKTYDLERLELKGRLIVFKKR